MTYLGALRLNRQKTPIVLLVAALVLTLANPLVACAADAEGLQKQGIQKVNQYLDYMRRTGDVNSMLPELLSAQAQLRLSADAFLAEQNPAGAALSFLRLGDIERWQNHWDAARSFYSRALELAKQARTARYEAQALTQLTRTELLGKGDLGAAAEDIRQAIPLATASGNQDCLFDALDEAANLEIKRGNLNAAADYLDRALALKDQLQDKSLAMYGYADRADFFYQRGGECDYTTHFSVCDDAFQKAHDDYLQASNLARASGFDFVAEKMHELMENVDARRHLTQTQGRYSREVTEKTSAVFHPKKPSEVLVNPHFTPGPDPQRQAQLDALIRAAIPNIDAASDPTGLYVLGMSAEMKGDNQTALTNFKKAVALVERDRRNLRDEQSRGTFLEDKITLYYSPILLLLDLNRNAEAFDLMERSRSRAMADLLSGSLAMRTPLERDLFSQWMKLKEDIALLQKKLFVMNSEQDRDKHADDIADTKARIGALERQSEQAQANIAAKAPRLRQLTESPSVSLADAQMSAKRDDYDLLYYLVVENNIIIWDINEQDVKVVSVFLPHTQLSAKVTSLSQSLVAHESDENAKFDAQTSREFNSYGAHCGRAPRGPEQFDVRGAPRPWRRELPGREISDFLRTQRHSVGLAEKKTQPGARAALGCGQPFNNRRRERGSRDWPALPGAQQSCGRRPGEERRGQSVGGRL
jgi:tetratricopeptide (TPR) repeat protein